MNEPSTSQENKPTNITLKGLIGWIFGVLALLAGLVSLFSQPLVGVLYLLMAAIALPPVSKWMQQKNNVTISTPIKVITIIVLLFLAGTVMRSDDGGSSSPMVSNSDSDTDQAISESGEESTQKPKKEIVEPEDTALSGSGQQATDTFKLEKGLSVFRMTHQGNANFIVQLLDNGGNAVDMLVTDIGQFDGAKAVHISSAGDYLLDISANDPWTITIEQPRKISSQSTPITLNGNGQSVTEFVQLNSGLVRFEMNHTGQANFIVALLDENGKQRELLVNNIGPFDGSKAVHISKTGNYLLDVQADGQWTIKVE